MSDILLGVIIGGVIGIITPTTTIIVDYHKWKKSELIKILTERKKNLEEKYREIIRKFKKGVLANSYDIEMIADFEIIFPKKVLNAFNNYMKDNSKNIESKNGFI